MKAAASGWERVYRVVRRVPSGRVASYGQVAALAGMPRAARQVGYALHALEFESEVPWHRVVNARGEISARGPAETAPLQQSRLESEGVVFEKSGRIDLARFGWRPRVAAASTDSRRPSREKPIRPKRPARPRQKASRQGRGSTA